MKLTQYKLHYPDAIVRITAGGNTPAVILGMANRINAGKNYDNCTRLERCDNDFDMWEDVDLTINVVLPF